MPVTPLDFVNSTLEYLEKSGEALAAADQLQREVAAREEAAKQAAAACVEELVSAGLVRAEDKEIFRQKVASHDGAIRVIHSLVDRLRKQAEALSKAAAVSGPGEPASSSHVQKQESRAYRMFEERLGLL